MDLRFFSGVATGITAAIFGFVIVIIGIIGIFFFAILGALIGAITGLILQFAPILGDMVVNGFAQVGIESANLAEIGAMLGFIAGFFKSTFHKEKCEFD